jgi:EAL and modified HD-GYP domain-containing signal transduction protein
MQVTPVGPITGPDMDGAHASSVAVARQPILDVRQRLKGYELLHRGGATYGEKATAQVLLATFGELGLRTLVGSRPAFINVTRRFLLDVDPLPLLPDEVVLELLEDQALDDELFGRLVELDAAGFRIALDDFSYNPKADDVLALASIVKVDLLAGGPDHAARQADLLQHFDVTLLAEKVEDEAMFHRCCDLGYELFQGYFFCKPELVSGREIPSASASALQDIGVLSRIGATFEEVEAVVTRDPGLTMRLLRLLNSAAYPLRRRITSVHEAVTLLGVRTVRQWAMLLVLGGIESSCDELVPTALSRARTLACLAAGRGSDTDLAFSVGLLSVADALLGVPMAEALVDLPLADPVVDALLDGKGAEGMALTAVLDLERGLAPLGASEGPPGLSEAYTEALSWSLQRTSESRGTA